jgi:glutamate 5-kinase
MSRNALKKVRRLVVKVGTTQVADPKTGVRRAALAKLAAEVASLRRLGIQTVLVSSGAIGLGMHQLGLKARPRSIPEKQATAAVGQVCLMEAYQKALGRHSLEAAQVLLTRRDLEGDAGTKNARNTMETLLSMGAVPVINENDTVAVEEIKFGENDYLSALVAQFCRADLLVILTDVDGLYEEDPRANDGAKLIREVAKVTDLHEKKAGGAGSHLGTGGMGTKLKAARLATQSGALVVIANGSKPSVLTKIVEGKDEGTVFLPRKGGIKK